MQMKNNKVSLYAEMFEVAGKKNDDKKERANLRQSLALFPVSELTGCRPCLIESF